ncbi:hypothetical protein ACIOG8_19250 [Streptomyces erythrochromogenes]
MGEAGGVQRGTGPSGRRDRDQAVLLGRQGTVRERIEEEAAEQRCEDPDM